MVFSPFVNGAHYNAVLNKNSQPYPWPLSFSVRYGKIRDKHVFSPDK
ncbi:hypothetical protein XBP1_2720004 [Xenorhabdus bovienii str. puntauvense]|uniref:Uncharacterized protein n=4 Tax=Xenorhabdus bovienii TaxID=40576 RepID=A0A0B6X7N0_XENBV|nr:hypothetical protein XBFFR1_70004 [Xenorhabdus bovienii str. feltiae France]CDG93419.1 hypothetical protein XBFFL1_2520003 [Xenorhabdus bovienii str. feltiae Florida]CDG97654.1 hypothetical protein XBP1_2720004 [Xenorhabdus bovienii str. puntauvense]CDH01993.1 hypothetical protein XBFM1_2420013 [Xenorhabdus bovienii str. feltiae Moldova]CDH23013.1 hypothetical protein XBKB1_1430003 [Xenorhabdus bovienii str. kraussei Becker Underwood]CDM89565.1 protein of unknown function [Xenorhabdus bovie